MRWCWRGWSSKVWLVQREGPSPSFFSAPPAPLILLRRISHPAGEVGKSKELNPIGNTANSLASHAPHTGQVHQSPYSPSLSTQPDASSSTTHLQLRLPYLLLTTSRHLLITLLTLGNAHDHTTPSSDRHTLHEPAPPYLPPIEQPRRRPPPTSHLALSLPYPRGMCTLSCIYPSLTRPLQYPPTPTHHHRHRSQACTPLRSEQTVESC